MYFINFLSLPPSTRRALLLQWGQELHRINLPSTQLLKVTISSYTKAVIQVPLRFKYHYGQTCLCLKPLQDRNISPFSISADQWKKLQVVNFPYYTDVKGIGVPGLGERGTGQRKGRIVHTTGGGNGGSVCRQILNPLASQASQHGFPPLRLYKHGYSPTQHCTFAP